MYSKTLNDELPGCANDPVNGPTHGDAHDPAAGGGSATTSGVVSAAPDARGIGPERSNSRKCLLPPLDSTDFVASNQALSVEAPKKRRHVISAEAREKMRKSLTGKKRPPEVGRKVSAALTGRVLSDEHRRKLVESWTPERRARWSERVVTAETRARRSAAGKRWAGTPENRAKVSARFKGRKLSDETRAKLRAARLGKKNSPETRAKMRAANFGKKRSPKSKAKMRASRLAYFAKMKLANTLTIVVEHSPEFDAFISMLAGCIRAEPRPELQRVNTRVVELFFSSVEHREAAMRYVNESAEDLKLLSATHQPRRQ